MRIIVSEQGGEVEVSVRHGGGTYLLHFGRDGTPAHSTLEGQRQRFFPPRVYAEARLALGVYLSTRPVDTS
ncbi:hypothetical protein GVX82_03045 [Patescibacteria group bacterium]|jgi:hypothetical protein|nr:hypothetical protein [Patescibacteria group bacterium]